MGIGFLEWIGCYWKCSLFLENRFLWLVGWVGGIILTIVFVLVMMKEGVIVEILFKIK